MTRSAHLRRVEHGQRAAHLDALVHGLLRDRPRLPRLAVRREVVVHLRDGRSGK